MSLPDPFVTLTEEEELQLIIAVSRTSGSTTKSFKDSLDERNDQFLDFVANHVHIPNHESCRCVFETMKQIYYSIASNTDAASSNWKPYVDLRSKLEEYSKSPNRRQIIIFTSEADGFFTNAPSFDKFLKPFSMLNISLYCFYRGADYQAYCVEDVRHAVKDVGEQKEIMSPAHELVRTWVKMSVDKVMFSYAASHFRAEHPRRRNTTHVGPVPLLAPSETAETPQAKHYTRKPSLTLRWQDNEVYCPIEDCSDRFSSIQALVNHLNEKMLKVHHTKRVCLLCVLDPNTVRMKFDLHDRKKSHDHILRHFPPQLKCDQEKCSFATHDDIAFKYHQSSMHQIHNFKAGKKLHVCEICGNSYARKGELKRHLDSHSDKKAQCSRCGNWYAAYYIQRHEKAFCQYRDEENRKHQCPKCTRTYDTYDGLKSHLRRDHGQRDMIMNYAMSAGVVSEADKSLLEQLSTGPMIASPEGLNAPLETLTSVPGHSTSVSSQAPPILQHDYDLKTDPFLQLESKSLSSLKMSSGSTSLTSNITTNHPNIFSPIETTDAPHVPPESTPNRRQTSFGFAAQALISSPAVPLQDLPLNAPTDIVPAVGNVRRSKRRRNPIQLSPYLLEEQTYQLQMKKARMLD